MFLTRKHLRRRTFLRGLGATVALPLLDAMVPAATALAQTSARPVRRFGVVYAPNGMNMRAWIPQADGPEFALSPILQPLAAVKKHLVVVSGLSSPQAKPLPGEGPGDHARGCANFLTGVHPKKTQGSDFYAGISVDQIAARSLGTDTPLPSLELGLDSTEPVGSCDFDYTCTYVNTMSWLTPTTPLPVEISPRVVFERLFGDGADASAAARAARNRRNRTILDSVLEDARRLNVNLGARDRVKVTEYLDAVRQVEQGIQRAEAQGQREIEVIDRPADVPSGYADHARLMFDLQVLAFQADMTRVGTLMLGREVSTRSYPEIGVPDSHHPLSHHQRDAARLERLAKVNAYHTELFAYYLQKLEATPDGDGTLLDSILILYGASLSDSNDHTHDDLPILVAGGGGGVKGDRHLRYPTGTLLSNLQLTMLRRLGIHEERFGDSTGELQELSGI